MQEGTTNAVILLLLIEGGEMGKKNKNKSVQSYFQVGPEK